MGSAFVAIRHVGDEISPGALTLGRLLVGSLVLGMVLTVRGFRWPCRHDWPLLLLALLAGVLLGEGFPGHLVRGSCSPRPATRDSRPSAGLPTWAHSPPRSRSPLGPYALSHTTAGRMGATTYLVPPVTIVLAWALLSETPVAVAYAGGALCLAEVALSRRTGTRSA